MPKDISTKASNCNDKIVIRDNIVGEISISFRKVVGST